MELAADAPSAGRLILERDDGSSVVEVPITVLTDSLDLDRTEGGGGRVMSIGGDMLDQMVRNFSRWPKPVGVGFDGLDGHQPERGGPQMAFVNKLRVDRGTLVAEIDLGPQATEMVVRQRDGWVLTGGIFTNNPATDTQYQIAATECDSPWPDSATRVYLRSPFVLPAREGQKEHSMDKENVRPSGAGGDETVSLRFHEMKLSEVRDGKAAAEAKVDSLTAQMRAAQDDAEKWRSKATEADSKQATSTDELAALRAKGNRLEVELKASRDANTQLTASLNETVQKLKDSEARTMATEVKRVVLEAIDQGVPPAIFEGYTADPADWVTSKFASLEAFKTFVESLGGVAKSSAGVAFKSGHDPADDKDAEVKLTEEEAAVLEGKGTEFIGVTSEKEARRIHLAKQKAAN
jgi:hypothetical protein